MSEVKRDRYQWCGAVTGAADQAVTGAADFTVTDVADGTVTGAADPQWPARCWHRECPVTGEKHMLLTQGTCCARRSPGAHAGLRRLLSGFTPRDRDFIVLAGPRRAHWVDCARGKVGASKTHGANIRSGWKWQSSHRSLGRIRMYFWQRPRRA